VAELRFVRPNVEPTESGEMLRSIRRELQIAFSKRTQPIWVRATKWAIFLGVAVVLYGSDFFVFWVVGLPFLGVLTHFLYRWKTHGWTRPWGGWNDVDAGRWQ
jgi:polyferredoxin